MSHPVHQLSLNPGGLFSDTIPTDSSHQCSICVCTVYISVVDIHQHPAASRGECPVCLCVYMCMCL